ncbi:uncharacterized protein PHALS_09111 [Plasmopara halstedii]|uniref:Uncharacterized protein n=1 Tax=Plasmopara halstedii TaxID=4781 RepID=A0A0P1AEY7_PLAHL|nr:uncharacterized protein PHALS_09111 [Plasmopara halstedii]CEG39047.1 hypothetical protein PHALS_09111 [Plasmopara halstedii]|eukprot:XP_024575416.1 hypothetical protein PHALS_09111 [Plasmopara halstedii]
MTRQQGNSPFRKFFDVCTFPSTSSPDKCTHPDSLSKVECAKPFRCEITKVSTFCSKLERAQQAEFDISRTGVIDIFEEAHFTILHSVTRLIKRRSVHRKLAA